MTGRAAVRAAVATAPGHIEMRSLPLPEVGPDDGWLEVEASGVCGTDIDLYNRSAFAPLVLGHEVVGRVGELGEQAAERWQVRRGQRVVVEEFLPCGACSLCVQGDGRLCAATDFRGSSPYLRYGATPVATAPGLWGGFSEVMYLHPRSILHPIGPELDASTATLFVPISNGRAWVALDDGAAASNAAVVLGPGQHGLATAAAAIDAGLAPVIVVGLAADAPRLEAARALGDVVTLVLDEDDVEAAVSDLTDGTGAGLVVDVTPAGSDGLGLALRVAAMRGTVVLAGGGPDEGSGGFDHRRVVANALTLRGVRGRPSAAVDGAIRWMHEAGQRLDAFPTRTFPLAATHEALAQHGGPAARDVVHTTVVP